MSPTTPTPFSLAIARLRAGADLDAETDGLFARLTADEKLDLLDGDDDFWTGMAKMAAGYNVDPIPMCSVERLGIPGFHFSDGPRGAVIGRSTAFPVSMARGATWDVELEEQIGRAIGREVRAQGGDFFGGVCINLPRHPAWGRAQETYGEDPLILGEFGAALVRGVKRNAMAVAKHFALNSMENARFSVDVAVDDEALHEVYLPHFRRAVEAGADGIMTAYNSVNGEWAGQNAALMEGVLREKWGFDGVTVSDFVFGFRDAAASLRAGLDVEEPFRQQRAAQLPGDLEAGRASWSDVDRAARRVLRTQLRHHSSDLDPEPSADVVFCAAHRELARRAAAESVVVLVNEPVGGMPVLPLDAHTPSSLAVVGRLADVPNTGDKGSSAVRTPSVVTPLDGIRAAAPALVVLTPSAPGAEAAAQVARDADAAVVIVGYTAEDEGEYIGREGMMTPELLALFPEPQAGMPPVAETIDGVTGNLMGDADGGDRRSLRLLPGDVELIRSVAAANPRTVVVIVTAGAVIAEEWRHDVPALAIGWYNGSEGGHGLADVLFGKADAAGRLPYSIPTDEAHLPTFDARPDARAITYDKWFGQRLLDRRGIDAAFPLGFGLSYTSFAIERVAVRERAGDAFTAEVDVVNVGERRGRHVVQLYAAVDAEDFPTRVLVGFAPVHLDSGERATITIHGSTRPVQRWTSDGFAPAVSEVVIAAAAYAGDPQAATVTLTLN